MLQPVGDEATDDDAYHQHAQEYGQRPVAQIQRHIDELLQRHHHEGLEHARGHVEGCEHEGQRDHRSGHQRLGGGPHLRRRAPHRQAPLFAGDLRQQRQGEHDADEAGGDQREAHAVHPEHGLHQRGRDGEADVAGEAVDRKGPAHAGGRHFSRQDRIIGRMIHGVAQPDQHRPCDQHGIGGHEADEDEACGADEHADEEQQARAIAIHDEARGRLGHGRDRVHHGDGEAKFGIGDIQQIPQGGHHGGEGEPVIMADQMHGGNDRQRAPCARAALCCVRHHPTGHAASSPKGSRQAAPMSRFICAPADRASPCRS